MGLKWKRVRGKLSAELKENIVGLVVSIFFALSLWAFQIFSQDYSSLLSVSVTALSNIEGHASESSNSSTIVARCRATGWKFFTLKNHSITVYFDPKIFHKVDDETFSISSENLAGYVNDLYGDDVQLESFTSSEVIFRFPSENNKKVPVQPVYQAEFKSQYMPYSDMKVSPDSVIIYGEPFHLNNIDRVYTSNITLRNLKSSVHGSVKIESISGVRISEEVVNYSMEVTRFVEVAQTVTIGKRHVPSGKSISVYPSTAKVVYQCAFPLTKDPSDLVQFYVDWDDFSKSINGRCVARNSDLPAGIISYTIEPQVFEVFENGSK